ncbi:MAG TPA: class I SAM-dependent methyltransferase [Vicinamibacterales bacterium]|nr:class I SAM-dependent methyltransferase [Vicinamibacterales bacterium]
MLPEAVQPSQPTKPSEPALLALNRVADHSKRGHASILHAMFEILCRTPPALRPRLQRVAIRTWYSLFSRLIPNDGASVTFLNYGYARLDGTARRVPLRPEDVRDEPNIELYEHVTASMDLSGRDVLEVGCGRGGGSSYLARYRQPRTMTGVDLAPRAVAFCRRRHKAANLKFLEGDAENLPFPAGSFDAVVNVESSHCYPSFDRFLHEVLRVLRPEGAFLFADLRPREQVAEMRDQLCRAFTVVEDERITPNISRALTLHSADRNAMILELVPRGLRHVVREFAAVEGTAVFRALKEGDLEYVRFFLRKPA